MNAQSFHPHKAGPALDAQPSTLNRPGRCRYHNPLDNALESFPAAGKSSLQAETMKTTDDTDFHPATTHAAVRR